MEISNRTVGIVFASAILISLGVRTKSTQGAAASTDPQVSQNVTASTRSIPDSNFAVLETFGGAPANPNYSGGTPNEDLINLNQAGAIVPGVTRQENEQPVAVRPAPSSETSTPQVVTEAPVAGDDMSAWAEDRPLSPSAMSSDRMLFDLIMGSLDENSRNAIRLTWYSMSPAEQHESLETLH